MLRLSSALVIDDSKVMRHVMQAVLAPHVDRVETAETLAEGALLLDREGPDIELVLCDVYLPDGEGFSILGHVARRSPSSRVLMMSGREYSGFAERAEEAGAIGFVGKPVSIAEIDRVWTRSMQSEVDRALRVPVEAEVRVRDADGEQLLEWRVRNLSTGGAFIETNGPLARGQVLSLELSVGGEKIEIDAEAVRVQEPTWLYPGGIGVRFLDLGDGEREVIAKVVAVVRADRER